MYEALVHLGQAFKKHRLSGSSRSGRCRVRGCNLGSRSNRWPAGKLIWALSYWLSAGLSGCGGIALNGVSAGVPRLTLSTSSLSFGNVTVNLTATQSVTLTSSGTEPLIVTATTIIGPGFSMSGLTLPLTLNPGGAASFTIEFDPTATGAVTGTVILTCNAWNDSTPTILLSGSGEAASYEVNLTWNAPNSYLDPIVGYNIYRATGDSYLYQQLNLSAIVPTTYTDGTVQNSTSYVYYVESIDVLGNASVPSDTFTVDIP